MKLNEFINTWEEVGDIDDWNKYDTLSYEYKVFKRKKGGGKEVDEDLKAEFEKWYSSSESGELDSVSRINDISRIAFTKGAEVGEAIGYQKGRGYERKLILKVAEQYFHECQLEKESPTLDMFEEMIKEPHKE